MCFLPEISSVAEMNIIGSNGVSENIANKICLQEFLVNKFKCWKPTAPEVVTRTKRDITLSWNQEHGGKTLKRIDDLAPSHPHKFRLKVILKASAVPRLAEIALEYYGDQNTVYEKLCEIIEATDELNIGNEGQEEKNRGSNNNNVNVEINVEATSETCVQHLETGSIVSRTKENRHQIGDHPTTRDLEKQKWIESVYSEETWTNTDTEGTSAVCFCMAVKCGYLKQVQTMLDERPELLGIVNASSGFTPLATATPLHLAVLAGHMAIVEHLIERGADCQLIFERGGDVEVKDSNGWSPLFRAICQGAKTEIIEELVMRGSDVDAVDNAGLPLTSAARLLKNRQYVPNILRFSGRSRDSILRLVDSQYPHEKALANFTRLSKKVYNVHSLFKPT
ncbi:putative Ser/Thr-like protein kinase lyk4 [Operophtera brumata]|uniref:Putative Ser/Thr-like protein kinase lyk4 n=1 Tax=Operophtera brumata TaxID=104452 RepID=A0A0L7LQV4_OPEBR|nr:putative Ser/Thr-like protein kinase lyk4 [Operophtera brumata]